MFNKFLPITKVDPDERMVYGWASTPDLDSQGEIVTLEAIKKALPEYLKFPTIREMHQPSAVGITKETEVHDNKGLYIGAKVVDNNAWEKVKEGVYRGFSIGGRSLRKENDAIKELELSEISLVDSPANKSAMITLWKRNNADYEKIAKLFIKEVIQMAKRKEEKLEDTAEEVVEEVVETEEPEAEAEAPEEASQPTEEAESGEVVVDEVKEASNEPSDLQKILSKLDEVLSKNETVDEPESEVEEERIAKIDDSIAKVASKITELEERLAKVEQQPAQIKVKSAVVEKFDAPEGNKEIDKINKRLDELDKIRREDLPLYQENYMTEALELIAKRSKLS